MTAPSRWLARALAVALAAAALLPLATLGLDWVQFVRVVGLPLAETPASGFDGVRWTDRGGEVVAAYVVPRSGADAAGVRVGDRLVTIDYIPIASAGEADRQIERATGTVLTYATTRQSAEATREVRIGRTPTFLYPYSPGLWAATGWGFGIVAFLHLLAYITVAPLARRSPRARRSRRLIGAAFAWVGVNLMRWLWVSVLGPPPAGGTLEGAVFDGLTLVALAGWIAYPALLLDQSTRRRGVRVALRAWRWVLLVPPAVLALGVTVATLAGNVGPLPPDAFAVPILFYACVFVAAACLLMTLSPPDAVRRPARIGNALVGLAAVVGAFVVSTRLGPGPRDGEVITAWFVVGFQLFSLLPVALVSFTTLRYGAFDALLLGSAETVVTLAAAFGVVVGGAILLDTALPGGSDPVALGVLVVAVLLVAERATPALRAALRRAFQTERERARRRLDALVERIRTIGDVESLAEAAATATGEALGARSAVVFLLAARGTADERWARATYRPEPPTFTDAEFDRVWARVRDEGRVWARNEELDEADLPIGVSDRLRRIDAALAVPVTSGEGEPAGLIVLGRKTRRLTVYDTEDVALLRSLAAQLAVATERLRLVDRERALVRQTADAEMAALRAQINPHFLFNALNTVAALIGETPEQAEATVEDLAALFRDVLNASGRPVVPLRDELRLVRRYLAIESARFGEKLAVEVAVAPDAEDAPVPAFAVQTLVENAVKHGVEKQRGGGGVTVTARRAAGRLTVVVEDTGVGLPPGGATFGVGLSNVADRLRLLHGDDASLTVEPTADGARATLSLPIPDFP